MKPTARTFLLLLLLAGLLWAGPALAAKQYTAERFDVLLDLQADGSLLVTETVRFRFEGGPFTYAFRDLAFTELDEIDRLQAAMDGAVLPQGSGPGQVQVVAGHPLKVTWHLAPTSDTVHEFVLTYRVQGALRQEPDADALRWRAIPEDHDYAIEHSTITLRTPESAPLLGAPTLSGAEAAVQGAADEMVWTAAGLDEDQSVVVTARFAAGSLLAAPPEWQAEQEARQQRTRRAVPLGVGALGAGLGLGLAALARFRARWRRAAPAVRPAEMPVTEPPEPIPPGLAVALAGRGTPALATLLDLAARGVLRIQEEEKRRLGQRRYRLERLDPAAELHPHEWGVLTALFEDRRGGALRSRPLQEVGSQLASRGKLYTAPLEQELVAAGWLSPARKAAAGRLGVWSVIALLLGLAALIAGFAVGVAAAARGAATALQLAAVGAGLGGALLLLGFVGLASAASLSPLTAEGEQAAQGWRGFAGYLKAVIRGKEFLAGEAPFEHYLPYAAGFGLGAQWAKHVQKQGYVDIPTWYRSLGADTDDFGGVVAVLAATQASLSSGDGSAAGAAGASGGGASGAG